METLIVQLGVKHGRVAELTRSKNGALSVGRSFDNDLVLTDLHVAPKQIEFRRKDDQWFVTVLDDTNPVMLNGKTLGNEAEAIESGDKITVGRTNLSLYAADHPVEKTRELAWSNWLHRHSKGLLVPFMILIALCLIDPAMDFYQYSINLEWKEYAYSAFGLGIFVIVWAGCWALAGRLLRHQQAFGLQLMATSLVCLGLVFLLPLESYLSFLSNNDTVGEIASYVISFAVVAALLRLNLFFATNIKNTLTVSVALSGILMFSIYGLVSFEAQADFETRPMYSTVLKPPFAQIGKGDSIDEYLQGLEKQVKLLEEN